MSTASEVLEGFAAVCADPYATARAAAANGRRIAGYMCTYTPEELFHAAGYLPVRILGWSESTQGADGLLQAYACSLARATLDLALAGHLDFLSLMVFSHTCDTIQNLADIWKRNVSGATTVALATPVLTRGEEPVAFFRSELQRVRRLIENQAGAVSDDALRKSIALYEEHRKAMRRLYDLRRASPSILSGEEMLFVVLSSFLMPKEDHLRMVNNYELEITNCELGRGKDARPRVYVVGAACQSADYAAAIEEAGCAIVDDDLCTGSRAFAVDAVDCADPIESLARMYLTRRPCASKHEPGYDPGAETVKRSQTAEADGVIFLFTKFCDPWAFDYVRMREALEQAGVPSLLLEIEQHVPPSAQFETRVAAFAELLQEKGIKAS